MSHVFRQKYFSCVCVLCIEIENTVFSMFCNPTEWRMVKFNRNLILRSVGWQKCSAGGLREVMSIFMFMLNYDLIIKSTHLFRWFWVTHYDCHKMWLRNVTSAGTPGPGSQSTWSLLTSWEPFARRNSTPSSTRAAGETMSGTIRRWVQQNFA